MTPDQFSQFMHLLRDMDYTLIGIFFVSLFNLFANLIK